MDVATRRSRAARSSPNSPMYPKSFGDKTIDQQLQRHDPARRQDRPDRPQWRRQDHAAQADPRRTANPTAARSATAPTCRSPTSTRCATRWTWTPRSRTSSAPAASGSRSATSASTSKVIWPTSCSRPARANSPVRSLQRRRAQPAAAGAPVRAPGQRAGAGRAYQRSGHRHAGAARRPAPELRGTVFLVSHDRPFLDNVVTSTIAFEGDGRGASTKAACRTGWCNRPDRGPPGKPAHNKANLPGTHKYPRSRRHRRTNLWQRASSASRSNGNSTP